jgi:hypothetical protein
MKQVAVEVVFSEVRQAFFCHRPKIHPEFIAAYYSATVTWKENPT